MCIGCYEHFTLEMLMPKRRFCHECSKYIRPNWSTLVSESASWCSCAPKDRYERLHPAYEPASHSTGPSEEMVNAPAGHQPDSEC